MDDEILLNELEQTAEKLGITVRHDKIDLEETSTAGGLCLVKGKYFLILNSRSSLKERIETAVEALRQYDLSGVYLKPFIRRLLEGDEE